MRSLFGMWDVPFLGYGGAIAFGMVGCDRSLGMLGNAIAFWGCGMRSLWGCGGAIAVWDVGCTIFGDMGVRSLLGCGDAIAFGICEGDRFWDDGERSPFLGCGGAIAVFG